MEHAQSSEQMRNRVAASKSPYVSSQASSPVAWQLLDEEAVARAKAENKMIFLNIGYNACHFCHLMMTEGFSHPQCADLLNNHFVPVLVDREERPDIDTIYMNYVQAVNGAGGWPLNLFLTPDLAPVFGGTYWPGPGPGTSDAHRRHHRSSSSSQDDDHSDDGAEEGRELDLLLILGKLRKVWQDQEVRCRAEAKEVLLQLRDFAAEGTLGTSAPRRPSTFPATMTPPNAAFDRHIQAVTGAAGSTGTTTTAAAAATATETPVGTPLQRPDEAIELDLDQLEEAYAHIAGTFDPVYGGFGIAPKFPTPSKLSFLLRLSQLPPEVQHVVGEVECAHAHEMALFTLRKIRDGGLRDHVGGQGLARYSVTSDWSVPHFEKLTADNALLLSVYLDAWLSTGGGAGDEFYDVVVELAEYLSSAPICLPGGGFASSEAADSYYRPGDVDLRNGAWQLWTRREFDTVLGEGSQEAEVAAAHWNVLEHGNVDAEQDPHDEFMNRNVLRAVRDPAELSRLFKIPPAEIKAILKTAKGKLRAHRERERVRPAVDDKVVASWNGLAIGALARASAALRYVPGGGAELGEKYLDAARRAAVFVRREMWDAEARRLYRIYRGGRGVTRGFAEDYAYLVEGLLELYHATMEEEWLKWADELQQIQIDLFYDAVTPSPAPPPPPTPTDPVQTARSSSGGFYSTERDAPLTILRLKDGMDTSLPSANAVAASNLFRLGAMVGEPAYAALAAETVGAFEAEMLQYPWLFPGLLSSVVSCRLGGDVWAVVRRAASEPVSERVQGQVHAQSGAQVQPQSREDGEKKGAARSQVNSSPGSNGHESVGLDEFLRAVETAPRGGMRALVGVPAGSGDSWLVGRNAALKELVESEKGAQGSGIYKLGEDGKYCAFSRKDLAGFTHQA